MPETAEQTKFTARREIQPHDKEGNPIGAPHVYIAEASTQAEADRLVADKMADAIANGTVKIRELNLRVKNGDVDISKLPPDAEVDDYRPVKVEPKPLTEEEKFQLAQDLKDPNKMQLAYRRLYQAETGMEPIEDARLRETQRREQIKLSAVAEAEAFSKDHPEFYGTATNKKAMLDYMVSRQLKWTKKNLEIAFRELKSEGLLDEIPVEAAPEPPAPEPPRTEAEAERKTDRFPSAIQPSKVSGADRKPKAKGPSAAELAMMTADQLKKYYQDLGQWPDRFAR